MASVIGKNHVVKDELSLIPIPQETDSYKPVGHFDFADKISNISNSILTDYAMVGEDYVIARQGNQMFGVLNFQRKEDRKDINLSVAIRNSYDRSMSLGIAVGASVLVCENLMLEGDIAIMKKHTKNVYAELEDTAITTVYKANQKFELLTEHADRMTERPLGDTRAFELMGLMFGTGIISPRQLTVLKREWIKPSHEEFHARNYFSLYNATTEALKSSPPIAVMENYKKAHGFFREVINVN